MLKLLFVTHCHAQSRSIISTMWLKQSASYNAPHKADSLRGDPSWAVRLSFFFLKMVCLDVGVANLWLARAHAPSTGPEKLAAAKPHGRAPTWASALEGWKC